MTTTTTEVEFIEVSSRRTRLSHSQVFLARSTQLRLPFPTAQLRPFPHLLEVSTVDPD
jgi:hypothetical protein